MVDEDEEDEDDGKDGDDDADVIALGIAFKTGISEKSVFDFVFLNYILLAFSVSRFPDS
jgi:hypothetical protein